ncbi:acyltransferase [Enterococcus dongliensis]|uniref:acyltransferase n=1 Tax=Enterococcus dongliensis TaxID=2559925 RepID=UPI00288D1235|nr:acyltransferase [Enterococcus dongliensis]MDT2712389.1 acyltransferase [Enterococcus dongliensis]
MHLGLYNKCNAIRFWIRRKWYASKGNYEIDNSVRIMGPIDLPRNNGRLRIGNNTIISKWSCYKPYGGYISIGNNCTVNSFCHLSGNGGIEIGNNVLIATQVVIISANHNFDDINRPIREQGETREKITIEDNCWIGAGAKILAGVTIHQGSVIGTGAVITKDIPPNSVVVGIPGKVLKNRE